MVFSKRVAEKKKCSPISEGEKNSQESGIRNELLREKTFT